MQNTRILFGNDIGDILTAIENALMLVEEAQEEMAGLGEIMEEFDMLGNVVDELTAKKDKFESYMSGEYQQERAELTREYYRSVI